MLTVFFLVFDLFMALIFLLYGRWFYHSDGKAADHLTGYNMRPAAERRKVDGKAMCEAYGKRLMFMAFPFAAGAVCDGILGVVHDGKYLGYGCYLAWGVWIVLFILLLLERNRRETDSRSF